MLHQPVLLEEVLKYLSPRPNENFVDAIGILGKVLENGGGKLVGFTKNEGYEFEASKALRGDDFCGLALDFENQARQVKGKIKSWVDQIKKEFK